MANQNRELAHIAKRASSFTERCSDRFQTKEKQASGAFQSQINQRIEKWAQAVGQGDLALLEQRLSFDGLTIESVRPYLGPVEMNDRQKLPGWTAVLAAYIQRVNIWSKDYLHAGQPVPDRCADAQNPQPFEDLLLPLVAVGREKLDVKIRLDEIRFLLSEEAYIGLEQHLLQRLAQIAAPTLLHEFWQERLEAEPMLAFLESDIHADAPERSAYIAFVEWLMDPQNLWAFFEQYSALGRLLAETVELWVTAAAEFIGRLEEDWPLIAWTFFTDGNQNEALKTKPIVTEIRAGLSDAHNQGRTVLQITIEGGLHLIYKPHGLGLERAYQDLTAWINESGDLLPFRVIQVLDCQSHGWVESIAHKPCQSQEEAQRYYTRCGMLAALMFVLHGTDFHFENIIACGEHPLPVDLEMLLKPPVNNDLPAGGDLAQFIFKSEIMAHSVLASGLLPFAEGQNGERVEASFLGAAAYPVKIEPPLKIVNPNSDGMRWQKSRARFAESEQRTIVPIEKEAKRPQNFAAEIEAGFRVMGCFLMERKALLLAEDSPLTRFKDLTSRFVFRPTRIYYKIYFSSLQPQFMGEGIDRHLQLEQLSRIFCHGLGPVPRYWPLLGDEIAALAQGDTPIFHMTTSSRDLASASGAVIVDTFAKTGYEAMMATLTGLTDKELQKQAAYLRLALGSLMVPAVAEQRQDMSGGEGVRRISSLEPAMPLLGTADFLAEADRIGGQIGRAALHKGKQARWVSVDYNPNCKRCHPILVGYDLYNGQVGIALFLAALWRVNRNGFYRDLAYAALHDLRQRLAQGYSGALKRMGGGALTGLGSLIYGLSRCALFLEDGALADATRKVAALNAPELMVAAEVQDLESGLRTPYEAVLQADLNETADLCCGHWGRVEILYNGGKMIGNETYTHAALDLATRLVMDARKNGGYHLLPGMPRDVILPGFFKGLAGIGYSCLRLAGAEGLPSVLLME